MTKSIQFILLTQPCHNKMAGRLLCLLILGTVIASCSPSPDRQLHRAKDAVAANQFAVAVEIFQKVAGQNPRSEEGLEATREAARIYFYELKNYEKAVQLYQILVINSKDPVERLNAQRQIVTIYYEHLGLYSNAIIEMNRLLPLLLDPSEKLKIKMALAQSYYYQNNFFQAEMEADEYLRISKNSDQNFQMSLLKANIILARKDLVRAADLFRELMRTHPKQAAKENVGLTLAIAYEEMKDYKRAIEVLQEMKAGSSQADLIDIRLKKLEQRLKNQPGAKGFRK